eukprot:Amastigsp_a677397_114.p4 type:complete len:129 gc:universal Amastigsp_a677397_114:144-530(+)
MGLSSTKSVRSRGQSQSETGRAETPFREMERYSSLERRPRASGSFVSWLPATERCSRLTSSQTASGSWRRKLLSSTSLVSPSTDAISVGSSLSEHDANEILESWGSDRRRSSGTVCRGLDAMFKCVSA